MSFIDLRTLLPAHHEVNDVYFASNSKDILGQNYNGTFKPSNYFLRELGKTFPVVILKHKTAWFFTLSRDFSSQDISKAEFIPEETLCVVKNPDGFFLGLAEKSRGKYLAVFDIGHYLRREKLY